MLVCSTRGLCDWLSWLIHTDIPYWYRGSDQEVSLQVVFGRDMSATDELKFCLYDDSDSLDSPSEENLVGVAHMHVQDLLRGQVSVRLHHTNPSVDQELGQSNMRCLVKFLDQSNEPLPSSPRGGPPLSALLSPLGAEEIDGIQQHRLGLIYFLVFFLSCLVMFSFFSFPVVRAMFCFFCVSCCCCCCCLPCWLLFTGCCFCCLFAAFAALVCRFTVFLLILPLWVLLLFADFAPPLRCVVVCLFVCSTTRWSHSHIEHIYNWIFRSAGHVQSLKGEIVSLQGTVAALERSIVELKQKNENIHVSKEKLQQAALARFSKFRSRLDTRLKDAGLFSSEVASSS